MIPSIDDRLDSVVRALTEVVLPALPPDRSMAIEQAHLALAQIGVVRQQLDNAQPFERREAEDMVALAGRLCVSAEGGERTAAAAAALRDAIDAASFATPASIRAVTYGVGIAVEALIEASGVDGSPAFRAASLEDVLAAGRIAAMRDRIWNRASGFEADDSRLETIEALPLGA